MPERFRFIRCATGLAAGCAAMMIAACAVAPDVPVTEIRQPLSVREARMELRKLRGYSLCTGTSAAASCSNTIKTIALRSDALIINGNRHYELAKLPAPLISYSHFDSAPTFIAISEGGWIYTGLGPRANEQADRFANAILILKRAAGADARAQDEGNFEKAAEAYQAVAVKPSLPEDARRYKVQAEGAVRDKRFEDAADLFSQALDVAPWWPEGHFNRALVLGETGDFNAAILEMKRYLRLEPAAANARAAQDKIYVWEGEEEALQTYETKSSARGSALGLSGKKLKKESGER